MDAVHLVPEKYRLIIEDSNNICFISAASIWEISIKSTIGKLDIPDNYLEILFNQNFKELPVTWQHARKVSSLPMHHKDPFDRLLIAQSFIENLTLLSVDKNILKYSVKVLAV